MATLSKIPTTDKNLQLIQDNIDKALAQNPMNSGVVIGTQSAPVALASGANTIFHGLGRTPQYWTLLDLNASATVYRTAWDASTISLTASAVCSVILWLA